MTPDLLVGSLVLTRYRAGLVTDAHVAWLNDPKVTRYSEQRHQKHTLESQHRYLNDFNAHSHVWLIRDDGEDIGTITAYRDRPNKLADMGIMIGHRRGQGNGFVTWMTVMSFLYGDGVRRIEGGCMASNAAMRRIFVKSGMVLNSVRPGHFLLDGKPEDAYYYGTHA